MRLGLFGSAAPRVRRTLAPEPQITKRDLPPIAPPQWLVDKANAQGVNPMLEWQAMQGIAPPVEPIPQPATPPRIGLIGGGLAKARNAPTSGQPTPAAPYPKQGVALASQRSAPTPGAMMRGPQVKGGMQAAAQDLINNPRPQPSAKPYSTGPDWLDYLGLAGATLQEMGGASGSVNGFMDSYGDRISERALAAEQERLKAMISGLPQDQQLLWMTNPEEMAKHTISGMKPSSPQVFSTTNGLVAVTDGKPELIYGTKPEDKPQDLPPGMWYNPDTKQPEWIPGYQEGYRTLHPPSASSTGTKPPSGYRYAENPETGEMGLEPIPGGPADRGLNMNPQFIAMEMQQSKDWKSVYNNFSDITDQRGRIETMAAREDPAGDLALIVSFTKMLDPGSVAREGEVALTQSVASALQQAQMWLPRIQQGNTLLPPEVRKALLAAGKEMYQVYEKKYHDLAGDYTARAKAYGFAPERVLMGYRPPARPAEQPVDIDDLLDDVTSAIPGGYEAWRQREGLTPQQPQQAANMQPGTIDTDETGQRYRFKGGDPTDQRNWELVR